MRASARTLTLIGTLVALGLSSCGNPVSNKNKALWERQKDAPADGYWLCRLEDLNGVLLSFNEFKTESRASILGQCKTLPQSKTCAKAITSDSGELKCVRAKNLGHMPDRRAKTVCTLTYLVDSKDVESGETLDATGTTHLEASRALISSCLAHEHKDACSYAIISDYMRCKLL